MGLKNQKKIAILVVSMNRLSYTSFIARGRRLRGQCQRGANFRPEPKEVHKDHETDKKLTNIKTYASRPA